MIKNIKKFITKNNRLISISLFFLFLIFGLVFASHQVFGADTTTSMSYQQYTLREFLLSQSAFKTTWNAMIGLLDILVVVGFIIMALSNIFHIKYDEYQVQKALPRLIIGVILANLSYVICMFFVTVVQYITNIFIKDPATFVADLRSLYGWMWYLAAAVTPVGIGTAVFGAGLGLILLGLLIFLIPLLLVWAIGTILWFRAFVILVLIAFSPWAFFLNYFPIQIPFLTEQAQKWFQWFTRWLAIGPVMFLIFWIAFTLNKTGYAQKEANENQTTKGVSIEMSIQESVEDFCKLRKNNYKEINWNTGPCLTNNFNNTGIAVDVAHSPRQASDNLHTCNSPTKWIELNVKDCSLIRTSGNI